jgi:hypothetical protein
MACILFFKINFRYFFSNNMNRQVDNYFNKKTHVLSDPSSLVDMDGSSSVVLCIAMLHAPWPPCA